MTSAVAPVDGFRPLPDLEVVEFEGADAAAFLQAQAASDVAALAPDGWQWSSWLSAQGRVLALLLLLRSGPQSFLAVVGARRADELATRMRRYLLRAKLRLQPSPMHCSGWLAPAFTHGAQPQTGGVATRAGAGWELQLGGCGARRLRIGPDAASGPVDPRWALADIADGVPWIATAVADTEIPQALRLERLAAYSLSKGCYPGQEIVARTHYLGRSKRRLLRFHAAGGALPRPGESLPGAGGGA